MFLLIGKQLGLSAVVTRGLTGQSESGAAQVALRNISSSFWEVKGLNI